ncbi:MAG: hypothetical protein JST00_38355 [Deltaproteobacteria bacterium]|nr:hypothetical protein [Deltaproteobacteria bacterium]
MKSFLLLTAVSVASLASLAACSGSDVSTPGETSPAPTTTSATEPPPPAGTGTATPTTPGETPKPGTKMSSTPPVRSGVDAAVLAELTKGGLDPKALPATLEDAIATRAAREAVMKSFTLALGVDCGGCHVKSGTRFDYQAATPQKNVTAKMWTNFVSGLAQKDGSALYCDSCHQGKAKFLDRKDDEALGNWMAANFVDKLARADAAKHDCATCHGKPFDGAFLGSWKN